MLDVLLDSVLDGLKLLPFLFVTYLFIEYSEHKMTASSKALLRKAGVFGPFIGAAVGLIPQCGFSAVAAGLFAGSIISPGTLIAVFLSTSDEMLPVMIAQQMDFKIIIKILVCKFIIAAAFGLLIDVVSRSVYEWKIVLPGHQHMCDAENCGCEEHGICYSAMIHTIKTGLFIFVIIFVIGAIMELAGADKIADVLSIMPLATHFIAAIVGMIPNCAASVLITSLFTQGVIPAGSMMAGLLCGAGTGLLVLFREQDDLSVSISLTITLFVCGVVGGLVSGLFF